jgi:hypothetical protein
MTENTKPRRGKREAPIPPDAPARPLGLYLRAVHDAVGKPPYRHLEDIAGYSHNRLSTTANGYCADLNKIDDYIETMRQYARIKGIDLDHVLGAYARENGLEYGFDILTQARAIHAALPPDVQKKLSSRKAKKAAKKAENAAEDEIDVSGIRAIPRQRRFADGEGPPVPASLAQAQTLPDLVGALNDMITGQGWDLSMRHWDIHRNTIPEYLMSEEALDVLTGRQPLTVNTYTQILLAADAGYIDGDTFRTYDQAWITAWDRVATQAARPDIPQTTPTPRIDGTPLPSRRFLARTAQLISRLLPRGKHQPGPIPVTTSAAPGLPAPSSLTEEDTNAPVRPAG